MWKAFLFFSSGKKLLFFSEHCSSFSVSFLQIQQVTEYTYQWPRLNKKCFDSSIPVLRGMFFGWIVLVQTHRSYLENSAFDFLTLTLKRSDHGLCCLGLPWSVGGSRGIHAETKTTIPLPHREMAPGQVRSQDLLSVRSQCWALNHTVTWKAVTGRWTTHAQQQHWSQGHVC